jgi:putative sterol carrier protein
MPGLTCRTIFLQEIPTNLQNHPELSEQISGIFEFQLRGADGGTFTLDLSEKPPQVMEGSTQGADVIVQMTDQDFLSLYNGRLNGLSAFFSGRMRVKGNMNLAFQLGNLLKRGT